MGIPTQTRLMDDAFTHTWSKIQAEATDNILDSNVVTAALRAKGCFKTQIGGEDINRTIRYGQKTTKNVKKGDTLGSGETELKTQATWQFKTISAHVQRSFQDDRANTGEFQIKSLVDDKIGAAKDALDTEIETTFLRLPATSSTNADINATETANMRMDRDPNSLWNMMPGNNTIQDAAADFGDSASFKLGGITLDNAWWQAKYNAAAVTSPELNLLGDMRSLYNKISNNLKHPTLIITNQTLFEYFEDFAIDMTQIIKSSSDKLADLGYDVLRFKGQDMVWTDGIATNRVMMIDTDFVEVVYDPNAWFEMTEWKYTQLQLERIAHILAVMQIVTKQPRRHGWLGTYA